MAGGKQSQKSASKAAGATRRLGDRGNLGSNQRSGMAATKKLGDAGKKPFPATKMPDGDQPSHRSAKG